MYTIDNIDAKFLLAAQQGNLEKLKKYLKAGVKLNTVSLKKESALHLAALNGHIEAIKFLVNAGIKVNLRNTDNLTASQIAYSKNNHDTGTLLDFISLAFNAAKFAKDTYSPANDYSELSEYRSICKRKFNNLQPLIISNIKNIYRNISQADINDSAIYALRLVELFVATKVAVDNRQSKGLCAEMSRASYCYLIKRIKEDDLFNIAQIGITSRKDADITHSFIVFNLSEDAVLTDLSTWGNAIVCDSSHNRIGPSGYFVAEAPVNSAINLIKNKTFYISKPFERRPRTEGELAISLNNYWNDWILKISSLYPNDPIALTDSPVNVPCLNKP